MTAKRMAQIDGCKKRQRDAKRFYAIHRAAKIIAEKLSCSMR